MPNPFRDLLFGGAASQRELVEVITPRRSFADVILPPETLRALKQALVQIEKHDVLFHEWGLGERHTQGLGLAFNFAGPPGTGKTICAEAIAHALRKPLMLVRYSELESMWAGSTGKNVSAVFRWAEEEDAVLFFDEADAIASRRFQSTGQGYEREANTVVNVLLRELEEFGGVVIFATNLAANFDPAFERRIRTHILFQLPGVMERERIWPAQLHPRRTPLADDVDFRALAERYAVSGGDIKNAVLKAAQAAIAEPGPDHAKRIHQRHLVAAMEEVLGAKSVMEQSLFGDAAAELAGGLTPSDAPADALLETRTALEAELAVLDERLGQMEHQQRTQVATLRELGSNVERRHEKEWTALTRQHQHLQDELRQVHGLASSLLDRQMRMGNALGAAAGIALLLALAALLVALLGGCAGAAPAPAAAAPAGEPLRVMVYNLHAGKDAAGQENLARVAELVAAEHADVVLLQEVDRGTERSGRVDQLAELARRTGYHAAFGRTLFYQGGEYGIALLSRWPVRGDTLLPLPVQPPQARAGGSYEPRGVLRAEVAAPGGALWVLNTHLDASRDDHYRRQEAAALLRVAAPLPGPVLLGGDLNATPESAVLAQLTATRWRDGWAGCGTGEGYSFPASAPVKRIDYLLLPAALACDSARVLENQASDHRAVLFVLRRAR